MLTVAERLRAHRDRSTPAEKRVLRVLLADYPVGGLQPVARLAAAASVSAPTVIRLLGKLGYAGYPAFQQALKQELATRSSSLGAYAARVPKGTAESMLDRAAAILTEGITASFRGVAKADLKAVLRLLADPRRQVLTIGGRTSSMLARYLAWHLQVLRPGVRQVPAGPGERTNLLLDAAPSWVVVAFDYRRYQRDTIAFAAAARERGAKLVVFTDPYLSPIARGADVVLSTSVAGPSPFDALTPALALVESVIALLVDRLGDTPDGRLARYDALSTDLLEESEAS